MQEIHIRKDDLRVARVADVTPAALADGAARLALELFSLTSNNVTYASMGEGTLGYWDFFPGPEGWGRLPVWGFATVTESRAPGVQPGDRFYGYYPISESLDVFPAKASPRGFFDGAPHRREKAAVYNQYVNVGADPAYDAAFEPEQTIFRPLYGTGWWAADCVMQGEPRPRSVVMSSASSKTALATAHQLRRLGDARLVALTSARNDAYVRESGIYHETLAYEAVGTLRAPAPAVYLDFLGRESLTAAVHRALGANLARSILVGATDWGSKPGGVVLPAAALPGPRPEFFFVPDYFAVRMKADASLGAAMVRDLRAFYAASRSFVTAHRLTGTDAIIESWSRLLGGSVAPREGLVLSF
ncbi:MAG TPA: DUF2855 family protein [Steroidobacteraceae bacterium]|nr:DUF2855 family protein [Steroidobacteraceae bacterium]